MNDVKKEEVLRYKQEEMHKLKMLEKQRERVLKDEEEERLRQEKREKALKASEKLGSLQEKWIAPVPEASRQKSKKSAGSSYDFENSSDDDLPHTQGALEATTAAKRPRQDIFDSSDSGSDEEGSIMTNIKTRKLVQEEDDTEEGASNFETFSTEIVDTEEEDDVEFGKSSAIQVRRSATIIDDELK